MTAIESKQNIQSALKELKNANLTEKAIKLFKTLGYNTTRQSPLEKQTYACFKENYIDGSSQFNEEKALTSDWKYVDLLFQISKSEIDNQNSLFDAGRVDNTVIESYLFFAIQLSSEQYSRTKLSQIAREVNKLFPMPVMILFRHGNCLTLSVINRRLHKRDESKDVLEKVTLIKDISVENPHRAHVEILFDLSFEELSHMHKFSNFVELHNAWQKTLDTKELNKKFYKELSNWYFWAMKEVVFPGASLEADKKGLYQREDKVREHNAKNLIRLLTRILFVWFIKEKNLIPDELFDENYIKDHLIDGFEPRKKKSFDHRTQGSKYYRAILQNLFFATLNQTVGKREFRKEGQQMNVTNMMRYENYFKNPKAFLKLVEDVVPFMNGGLFECLDSPDPDKKGKKGGDVIIYEDGFSDRKDNVLSVPDYIFFGTGEHTDLSEELDDKKQKDVTVNGLINILKAYKFTITENTPIEEEVALDPELLGRVFENLLASYNPETKTTARKQTGSFYTPREIVNYMVDESIKAYLKQKLETEAGMNTEDAQAGLEFLIGYNEKEHLFDEKQTAVLINAIDTCKILDPACGSGAFPMGILHKLVHILHKLDPQNKLWKERQIDKARAIDDPEIRDNLIADIETAFAGNELDYGRKLYLIENCIYGVDIQPIATQISKLRFFISLIVDQKTDKTKDNFGIRPLPNLETKFVAANTLIGIENPKARDYAGSLFDNKAVNELEEKLKDVRHRLFSAKTPATKRKLREDDQSLRKKMGDILIDSGWDNETARQLAGWDPYDQNASSPFFDPEWMFGVSSCFDIAIGNPPYVFSRENISTEEKKIYKSLYTLTQFKINLYILFIERSYHLLKDTSGLLFFITPNNWLTLNTNSDLRKFLLTYTGDILVLQNYANVFESASVDTVVIGFKKGGSRTLKYLEWVGKNPILKHIKDLNYYLNSKEYIISNSENLSDSKQWPFENEVKILEKIAIVKNGVQAYTVGEGTPICTEEMKEKRVYHSDRKENNNWIKYLDGVDVSRYGLGWSGQFIKYGKNLSRPREAELFIDKRILVRQIPSQLPYCIHACYIQEHVINDNNSMIIKVIDDERYTIKYILGILNSSLMSSWFAKEFGKLTRKIFPQFKVKELRTFPIPVVSIKIQRLIEKTVDYVLFIRKNSQSGLDFIFLERLIDAMVYELYFPKKIESDDAEVLKHLNNLPELKDDWSDEKKLKTIDIVYKELSDPKHPVSIAMAKMQEIPEIKIIEGRK